MVYSSRYPDFKMSFLVTLVERLLDSRVSRKLELDSPNNKCLWRVGDRGARKACMDGDGLYALGTAARKRRFRRFLTHSNRDPTHACCSSQRGTMHE